MTSPKHPNDTDRKDRAGTKDERHHNIETDAPGSEESLNDINRAVEDLIEQGEDDQKKD